MLRRFSGHLILPWSNLSDLSAEDCQDPRRFCISLPLGRALLGGSSGWQHMATICAQLSKIKPCLTCYMGLFVIHRYRKVGWFIMMVSNMNMHVFRVYCNFIQQYFTTQGQHGHHLSSWSNCSIREAIHQIGLMRMIKERAAARIWGLVEKLDDCHDSRNGPFIDDFPMNTSIYKGFSMAMLNNQMVTDG